MIGRGLGQKVGRDGEIREKDVEKEKEIKGGKCGTV